MTKQFAAIAAITLLSSPAALAQSATHKAMKHGAGRATASAKSVYVCKDCHQYFTPMQAKNLGYKDPDGGKLVKAPKIPAGYTPGLMSKS